MCDRNGKRGIRTSLIAGKSAPPAPLLPQRKDGASRGKELLAPVLFQGSTNALWFNQWLEEHLIPELKPNSTLILDNAAFHRKDDVFRIAEQAGHKVLFLPPYSPDFNCIEQDFATRSLSEGVLKDTPADIPFRESFRASSKKDVFILLLVLP